MAEKYPDPEVGRHVRYVMGAGSDNAGEVRAAIISFVDEKTVNLTVFTGKITDWARELRNRRDMQASWFAEGVSFDATKNPGTWHWPEHAVAGGTARLEGKKPDTETKKSDQKP